MDQRFDRAGQDVSNLVGLGHANTTITDQRLATLFYVAGLGFTRDPFRLTSTNNMWINIGNAQIHLPTAGQAQVLPGHQGLVVPSLDELLARLKDVKPLLEGTHFTYREGSVDGVRVVEATCPWGNKFRCFDPARRFGPARLGVAYIEFDAAPGTVEGIAAFYHDVFRTKTRTGEDQDGVYATISAGIDQDLVFRETGTQIPAYDGHHIQIYIADFSGPFQWLDSRGLITHEFNVYEYRFERIIDPNTGRDLHQVEHEVRSMRHPLYGRPLTNRDPTQATFDSDAPWWMGKSGR